MKGKCRAFTFIKLNSVSSKSKQRGWSFDNHMTQTAETDKGHPQIVGF